jgi:predicted AlkP superfamily pyrophosphatase or phosphodiesterase
MQALFSFSAFFSSFKSSLVRILFRMRILFVSIAILVSSFTDTSHAANIPRHVVLVVWDGMRPDFITEQYAPTLFHLSQQGSFFPIITPFIGPPSQLGRITPRQ